MSIARLPSRCSSVILSIPTPQAISKFMDADATVAWNVQKGLWKDLTVGNNDDEIRLLCVFIIGLVCF